MALTWSRIVIYADHYGLHATKDGISQFKQYFKRIHNIVFLLCSLFLAGFSIFWNNSHVIPDPLHGNSARPNLIWLSLIQLY